MDATAAPKEEASSLPGIHPVSSNTSSSSSTCQLCLEEIVTGTPTEGVTLSTCLHSSCTTCLAKWIEREEAMGQTALPTCPFCRSIISNEDVQVILGRVFKPREVLLVNGLQEENNEVDDLTQQWLNENTVPCGGCGCPTEKIDGCDLVECLCGFRFCFGCGQAARYEGCDCGNFFDEEGWDLSRSNDSGTPIRDGEGHVDFRFCIQRAGIRREREHQQWTCQEEEDDRWYLHVNNTCSATGSWLFTPKNDHGCILMLGQQTLGKVGYNDRQNEKFHKRHEEIARWANPKSSTCTENGSWLFKYREAQMSISDLARQLKN